MGSKYSRLTQADRVAIQPPPCGKYVLHFGGILPDLAQAVTYTLTVE